MKNSFLDSLQAMNTKISKVKDVERKVNKLELAHKKYGSNVNLKKKMTLTNFDDIVDQQWDFGGAESRGSQLNVIPESKGETVEKPSKKTQKLNKLRTEQVDDGDVPPSFFATLSKYNALNAYRYRDEDRNGSTTKASHRKSPHRHKKQHHHEEKGVKMEKHESTVKTQSMLKDP